MEFGGVLKIGVDVFIKLGVSFLLFGISTRVTWNREIAGLAGKNVGLPLEDEGDGDEFVEFVANLLLVSVTRDTWKRLREGLGNGLDIGDGIGLGSGDFNRELAFLLNGSRKFFSCLSAALIGTGLTFTL
jgi:hypothetical protein